jgi:hypothetical protein
MQWDDGTVLLDEVTGSFSQSLGDTITVGRVDRVVDQAKAPVVAWDAQSPFLFLVE